MNKTNLWLLDFGGSYTITEGTKEEISGYMNAAIEAELNRCPVAFDGKIEEDSKDRLWAIINYETSFEDSPYISYSAIPLSSIPCKTLEELRKEEK